jgi:hypothetical protein
MAIITKIGSFEKGLENVIELTKSELETKANAIDSYFGDSTNWSKVIITYKTDEGEQVNYVVFDASEVTPQGLMNPTLKGRDTWIVQSLTILDKDNGYVKFLKGELTEPEFADIVFNVIGNHVFSSTLKSSFVTLSNNDLTSSVSDADPNNKVISYLDVSLPTSDTGKYYIEFNIDANTWFKMIGVGVFDSDPSLFSHNDVNMLPINTPAQAYWINQDGNGGYRIDGGATGSVNLGILSTINVNDKVSIAVDIPNDKVWFGKNGSYGFGDPTSNTGGLPLNKSEGSFIRFAVGQAATGGQVFGSEVYTIQVTPTHTLAGFTNLAG